MFKGRRNMSYPRYFYWRLLVLKAPVDDRIPAFIQVFGIKTILTKTIQAESACTIQHINYRLLFFNYLANVARFYFAPNRHISSPFQHFLAPGFIQPLLYEFVNGFTYVHAGSKTIHYKI